MKQKLIIASLLTLLAVDSKASAPSSKVSTPRTTCSVDTAVHPFRLERISRVEQFRNQGAEARDLLFGVAQQPNFQFQQGAHRPRRNLAPNNNPQAPAVAQVPQPQFAPPPPMRALNVADQPFHNGLEAAQSAPRNHQNNHGRRSPHNNSPEFRRNGNSPVAAAQARRSPQQPGSPSYAEMARHNNQ